VGSHVARFAKAGQLSVSGELMRQWAGSVLLAITVGIAYFLASRLSLLLITKPDDVAVFCPAAYSVHAFLYISFCCGQNSRLSPMISL
jgi:hypothetical protein